MLIYELRWARVADVQSESILECLQILQMFVGSGLYDPEVGWSLQKDSHWLH